MVHSRSHTENRWAGAPLIDGRHTGMECAVLTGDLVRQDLMLTCKRTTIRWRLVESIYSCNCNIRKWSLAGLVDCSCISFAKWYLNYSHRCICLVAIYIEMVAYNNHHQTYRWWYTHHAAEISALLQSGLNSGMGVQYPIILRSLYLLVCLISLIMETVFALLADLVQMTNDNNRLLWNITIIHRSRLWVIKKPY